MNLLRLETRLTKPFFIVAWFLCSIWYSIVAGRDMARFSEEEKRKVFAEMDKDDEPIRVDQALSADVHPD